jgi:hypothetical protein
LTPLSPTTTPMSSHTSPQPPQVASRSGDGIDTHLVELGAQRGRARLQLGQH